MSLGVYSLSGSSHIECESLEDSEYLNRQGGRRTRHWDYAVSFDYPYVEGEEGRLDLIRVSNLRLKQQKHRYSVVLVVESDTPVEDNAIPSLLSDDSQGHEWEIVSSTQAAAEKGM